MRASTPTMWIYDHGTDEEYRKIMNTARSTATKAKGPLRIVHHTMSQMAMAGELELARKGVLVLPDATGVKPRVLGETLKHWIEMRQRPLLFVIMGKRALKADKDRLERVLLQAAALAEKRK